MFEGKKAIAAVGRVAAIFLGGIIFAAVLPCGGFAATQKGTRPSTSEEATPKQIQELMTLLADPKVRNWLEQQSKAEAASERAAPEESVSQALDSRLGAIREHIVALAGTLPDLPNQFEQGHNLVTADLGEHGRIKALLLLAAFIGLGAGVEWLFRKATHRSRTHLDALPSETVKERLHVVALRFAFAVGLVVAFALGSIGPFLAFDWPPLLRRGCSACSSHFLLCGSRTSSVTSCWRRNMSGSASFRWRRRPRVSGFVGSFGSSVGLPLVG